MSNDRIKTVLYNLEKFVWCPLRIVRNYPTHPSADAIVKKCIDLISNYEDTEVSVTYYWIKVTTKDKTIRLWNANKFYAWLNDIEISGRLVCYMYMPSRGVMFDFKKLLERKGYDLYPPVYELDTHTTNWIYDLEN